jgi:hypothetical protein
MRFNHWQLLLGPVLLIVSGCGDGEPYPVPVQGTVELDGKPLPDGKISFITPGKVPEVIDIRDGAFAGQAKWGERRIEVAGYRPIRITPDTPKHLIELMKDGKENYLPAKYHRDSTLAASVKQSGDNTFKFQLVSE